MWRATCPIAIPVNFINSQSSIEPSRPARPKSAAGVFFVEMNESERRFVTIPLPGVFVCFCCLRSAAPRLALEAPPLLRPLLFMMLPVLALFIATCSASTCMCLELLELRSRGRYANRLPMTHAQPGVRIVWLPPPPWAGGRWLAGGRETPRKAK